MVRGSCYSMMLPQNCQQPEHRCTRSSAPVTCPPSKSAAAANGGSSGRGSRSTSRRRIPTRRRGSEGIRSVDRTSLLATWLSRGRRWCRTSRTGPASCAPPRRLPVPDATTPMDDGATLESFHSRRHDECQELACEPGCGPIPHPSRTHHCAEATAGIDEPITHEVRKESVSNVTAEIGQRCLD